MVLIRNLLFMLALAVLTPLYALIAMASFPFGPKTRHRIIRGWPHLMAWVVKHPSLETIGAPNGRSGVHLTPKAGQSIGLSKPWRTSPLWHSGSSIPTESCPSSR